MTRLLRLAFDLDGTLFDVSPGISYDHAEKIRQHSTPHERACDLARAAAAGGHYTTYVTGRTEPVRQVTQWQLDQVRLPGPLHMQRAWRGDDVMTTYKADVLRRQHIDLYVGDTVHDANAAALAGVPFLHADHWRAGTLPVTLAPIVERGIVVGYQRADTLLKEDA